MPIQIQITGLTQQQAQDIGNAFDQTIAGREDRGVTKARWVELQLLYFIRNVVKGWKRQAHEAQLSTEQAQVEQDYQE